MTHLVDVVVPVFRGLEQTERCLHSLLRYPQATAHEIVAINDASPDPRIAALLRELARKRQITLIDRSRNLGFVRSVNEAMALHRGRDVVLVNNDTEVASDWLDRLSRCASAYPRVATVTPFSNNATICSYPRFCEDNQQPARLSVAELDAIFRRTVAQVGIEIPTGVGFCLYIRRACLDAVGNFDADLFGLGYGEEVDFCMRAASIGYRHILCADTYVYHQGSVSFGKARHERIAQAQRIIDDRFPEYPRLIRDHVRRDPSRHIRRAIDLERLRNSDRPRVLMIAHGQGGIGHHIGDLCHLLADAAEVLVLEPYLDSVQVLTWARPEEELRLYLDLGSDYGRLIGYLGQIGISRVHYHHVRGFPATILHLAQDLEAPYWCTVHDIFPVCPQYDLSSEDGHYCGEPNSEGCDRCLQSRPAQWPWDIKRWRREFATFLDAAELVIAPTRDTADRLEHHFPGLRPQILSHPELADSRDGQEGYFSPAYRKIAILGHITTQKGLATIADCARHASDQGLPLSFRIIGTLGSPELVAPGSPLSFTGEYEEAELPRLVAEERPDAFFFASEVPETHSYELSAARQTGLPIVAVRRGAFPERLSDYPFAYVEAPNTPATAWNRLFLSLPSAFSLTTPLGKGFESPERERRCTAYRTMYLDALETQAPAEPAVPIPAQQFFFPEQKRPPTPGIGQLFTETYDRGFKASLDQLRRSIRETEARLAWQTRALIEKDQVIAEKTGVISARDEQIAQQTQQLLFRAREHNALREQMAQLQEALKRFERTHDDFKAAHDKQVAILERTVAGLRNRIAELEGSTFWRITFPLRAGAHRLKAAERQLRIAREALPQRTRKMLEVLRHQGPRTLLTETLRRKRRAECIAGKRPEDSGIAEPSLGKEIRPLRMPRAETPLVSIVVPTYGHHEATYACLESIAKGTTEIAIEVIVIDDCFSEPAESALGVVENLEIVRNDANIGFVGSCNRGLHLARGQYLLFLNNDTLVIDGWLRYLLAVFDTFDQVGAVGAKLLFPNGRLQEAGCIVWRDGSAWNYGRGQDASDPRFNYVREVDYCSGACLLLPRDLLLKLGGFDTCFAPAYYEDTDICFSLRSQGYRVLYQPRAEVIHFEGVSHGKDENSGTKVYQERNRKRFAEKWRSQLEGHQNNGMEPERERDRGVINRLLWIEACMLTPDQDSGSLRAFRLLRILRKMGIKVTFIADILDYRQAYVEQLQQIGVEVHYRPYNTSVQDYLSSNARHQDVIVLCRHYIAIKYLDLIRSLAPDTRIVFDTVDLHHLRLRRQASLDERAQTKRLAKAAHREEVRLVRRSDLTLVVSSTEQEILTREVPSAEILVLSNVHDPVAVVAPAANRSDILFVGSFQHPPNVDAMRYFAVDIWPQIRDALPQIRTFVIGSKMPRDLRRMGQEAGLEMLGYVPDIEPYLKGCRLSVSPLRYGAGVKGKINQSMSYGLPVVATTTSVEGMSLTQEQNILVADSPEQFAKAVVRLYRDDDLWERISEAGLRNVEQRFSSRVAHHALAEMFERIGLPQ